MQHLQEHLLIGLVSLGFTTAEARFPWFPPVAASGWPDPCSLAIGSALVLAGALGFLVCHYRRRLRRAEAALAESKHAEQQLSRSEKMLRQLTENIRVVFWMTKADLSEVLFLSPAFEELWGRPRRSLYDEPTLWLESIHPDDRERVVASWVRLGRGHRSGDITFRINSPDATVRHVRCRSYPLYDEFGSLNRLAGTAEEMTDQIGRDRRQAVQWSVASVLAESAPLAQAVPRLLEGICRGMECDVALLWEPREGDATRQLQCRDVWHRLGAQTWEFVTAVRPLRLGPGEEPPGQVWCNAQPVWIGTVDPHALPKRAALALRLNLPSVCAFALFAGHGVVGVIEVFGREMLPPNDDWLQLFESLGSQIGQFLQRRRAEEQLQLQNATLSAAANSIVITGPDGTIEWTNAAFTQLTGYASAEVRGRNPRLLQSGRHPPAFYTALWDTILAGKIWRGQVINRRKDGTLYHEEMTITPVRDDFGQIRHFVAIKEDITQRIQMQNVLVQTARLQAVGLLAGGIAHDFSNFLTTVSGYSELLLRQPGLEAKPRHYAEQIEQAAQRAARLNRQLLAFSSKQELKPTPLDLNDVVRNMDAMLRSLVGEQIQLHTHLRADLGLTKADRGQIEQVILELTTNARDAMPSGGELLIETANCAVEAAVPLAPDSPQPGQYACLRLTDTGIGMTDEVKARLFEPFFTTKPNGTGSGFGLATSYGIIKQSDGYITFSSAPGRGTTVAIYLPQVQPAVSQPPQEVTAPGAMPAGTGTILLVEDAPGLLALGAEILSDLGYNVLSASDGPSALQLIRERGRPRLDLLLTDVVMPQMSGKELADDLRADYPDLKVLFTSGYTEVVQQHGITGPGALFLPKPYLPDVLARTVHQVLQG